MPYISMKDLEKLMEIENYLGEKENWSKNTKKIWKVIENVLENREKSNKKTYEIIKAKRLTDKNYGRKK